MAIFEVVFQGEVQPGTEVAEARARIGQLFQVDDRQLDMLFSGRRIVIKQGLEEAAADKYRQAIERAGARCEIQPMGTAPQQAAAQQPETVPAPRPSAAGSGSAPRDEFAAAFADVEAPELPLAPLGADMQDSYPDYAPLPIDLSALTLAPLGSDLDQLPRAPAPPAPDTGHLSLADEK